MIADHSQPLQQQTENYRHSFLPITDSSENQLSVPINRSTSTLYEWSRRVVLITNVT